MKKILVILFISILILPARAFEDCIISTDGKLSDISIEHNDIIDVYPIFTIMNEKNTLFLHPLKAGKTRFCVLKNGKQKVMFNVEVSEDSTSIKKVNGFDILTLDVLDAKTLPNTACENKYEKEIPDDFELDLPPVLRK